MNFPMIETSRLLLKGISSEAMKEIFENSPKAEIKVILGHRSEEEYLKEEAKHKQGYASYNRAFLLFLLIDKGSSAIIGRCGLHNWNKDHQRAEIGYGMEVDDYKKKGLMSEAVQAIIAYGFSELQLNRIEALVAPTNEPSLRILRKNHFTKEGVLREHYCAKEEREDSIVFSLLRKEWNK